MFDRKKSEEILAKLDEADKLLRGVISSSGIYLSESEHFALARDKLQQAITEILKAK